MIFLQVALFHQAKVVNIPTIYGKTGRICNHTCLLTFHFHSTTFIKTDINTPKRKDTDGKYQRTGGNSPKLALNGISTNYYFYQTPLSFFGKLIIHACAVIDCSYL